MILVFSHDDTAVVHLDDGTRGEDGRRQTLCGKRSFGVGLSRRLITCDECLRLKPKLLGGK
jgi:hypothetical protein